jgi:hypothetical protein
VPNTPNDPRVSKAGYALRLVLAAGRMIDRDPGLLREVHELMRGGQRPRPFLEALVALAVIHGDPADLPPDPDATPAAGQAAIPLPRGAPTPRGLPAIPATAAAPSPTGGRPATFYEVPSGTASGKCRSCPAVIYWIVTDRGARMPVDCEPAHGGEPPTALSSGRGVSHFATCPNAKLHSRRPSHG